MVNDKPKIYFDVEQDTVRPPVNLSIDYTILDEYFRSQPKLNILGTSHPNVQIFNDKVLWEITAEHSGNNKLYFETNDGMLADTSAIHIYVDTTSQNIIYDKELIATVGKEFIYILPNSNQKQTYNIIQTNA